MKQPNWMTDTEQYADALFGMVGNILTAYISRLAPFVVPLAPAFFFAHSVYGQVLTLTDDQRLALTLAGISALGLEIVGLMAAHRAVEFYSKGETEKAKTAVVITAVYLLIGIGGILLFENTDFNAKVTGVVMFIIAGMVYLLLGLTEDSRKTEREVAAAQEQEAGRQVEQLAWERQLQMEKLRLDHELKLKRTQAKATVPLTVAPTVLATDWRNLSLEQRRAMFNYSTEQIVSLYGVSDRTAERWQVRSRKLSISVGIN
jgi:hypothetical protein